MERQWKKFEDGNLILPKVVTDRLVASTHRQPSDRQFCTFSRCSLYFCRKARDLNACIWKSDGPSIAAGIPWRTHVDATDVREEVHADGFRRRGSAAKAAAKIDQR